MKSVIMIISLGLFSCARKPMKNSDQAMRKTKNIQVLSDDLSMESFQSGLKNHISRLKKREERTLVFGKHKISSKKYILSLKPLLEINNKQELLTYIQQHFDFMEVYGRKEWGQIMLTSYYSPLYPARLKPTTKYYQPIYKLPADLVEINMRKFSSADLGSVKSSRNNISGRVVKRPSPVPHIVPYYSRDEIDNKAALKGKGLELYYMDPIHAFFMQIQGSGELELQNGKRVQVGFAGKNGWKYESIGKFLFHVIPRQEMSLQRIEQYLRTLSKKGLYQFLNKNPSYVFFQKLKSKGRTTFGNEVVAGRTIAIDQKVFPLGALAFLSFQKPTFTDQRSLEADHFSETSRLVLAQDTGGAIKSAGRADLYWGEGDEAQRHAGVMKHDAKLWFLFPR